MCDLQSGWPQDELHSMASTVRSELLMAPVNVVRTDVVSLALSHLGRSAWFCGNKDKMTFRMHLYEPALIMAHWPWRPA